MQQERTKVKFPFEKAQHVQLHYNRQKRSKNKKRTTEICTQRDSHKLAQKTKGRALRAMEG